MIRYIQSAASQEVPPPYHFPGVTVNAFVCEACLPEVQAYCDRFFNLGEPEARGFRYAAAALWPYALLLLIDYPVMISTFPEPEKLGSETPYSDRGVISQREVFIAVPVIRIGTAPGTLLANSTLEWVLPFITVGNPMSAVCGREMLGLEKLRAEIDFGESRFPQSFRGRVKLPGWPPPTNADKIQRMLPFLDVDTGPVIPTFRGKPRAASLWTLFRSRYASDLIDALGSATRLVDSTTAGIFPTSMQTVSLKQFRDALQPHRALYQALISCRTFYENFSNFRFYKEGDVVIRFHRQGSFQEVFRLIETRSDGGEAAEAAALAAYTFNADIGFDDMRTLHTFPIDGGKGLPATPASSDLTAPWLRPWKGFFGPGRAS